MKQCGLIVLTLLSLPILLHVYPPSLQLGGLGLVLGFVGMTISPFILFTILGRFVLKAWTHAAV